MAQVTIVFDTETKDCICKVGDQEVKADYIAFYNQECYGTKGYSMEVGLVKEEKDGIRKYTRLMATKEPKSIQFGELYLSEAKKDWFSNILK